MANVQRDEVLDWYLENWEGVQREHVEEQCEAVKDTPARNLVTRYENKEVEISRRTLPTILILNLFLPLCSRPFHASFLASLSLKNSCKTCASGESTGLTSDTIRVPGPSRIVLF